jgi:hypothetical protein
MVVEASVVARLFRFRLLTIDARLVVSPAQVHGRVPAVAARAQRTIGARLNAAERVIDEGATSLAASRGQSNAGSVRLPQSASSRVRRGSSRTAGGGGASVRPSSRAVRRAIRSQQRP